MYYESYETGISEKYLKGVMKELQEFVLLGGWAVYFIVNRNFREATGRNYSGSRDIDLGFHMDADWNEDDLKNSAFSKSIKILEKEGFVWQGFRLLKNFHSETEREVAEKEAKSIPTHFLFPLYIDMIVDFIHPQFKGVFGFVPVDEPLLKYVFESEKCKKNARIFGIDVALPVPELLLAMKLNSLPGRDKTHKRIKDISDIFALLFFSGESMESLKKKLFSFYETKKAAAAVKSITEEEVSSVASALGFNQSEIKRVLMELVK